MATQTPTSAKQGGKSAWRGVLDAVLVLAVMLLGISLVAVLMLQPDALTNLASTFLPSGSLHSAGVATTPTRQEATTGGSNHPDTNMVQRNQQTSDASSASSELFESKNISGGGDDGAAAEAGGAGSGPGSLVCTPATRDAQRERLLRLLNATGEGGSRDWACVPRQWLKPLQEISKDDEHVSFADVGAHFGYLSAAMMHAFAAAQLGVNKRSLFTAYRGLVPGADSEPLLACSRMCDATVEACTHVEPENAATLSAVPSRSVEVHSFEPSQASAARLVQARNKLMSSVPHDMAQRNKWIVHNVPLSRQAETVHFPVDCQGEMCGLSQFARPGTLPLQATSFDELHQGRLAGITWTAVSVRSPGHEPAVLMGMQRVLSDQLVHLLEFGVHPSQGLWLLTRLSKLVVWLEGLGMACYLESPTTLFKLSAQCWADEYLLSMPSRVVCARINSKYEEALDRLTDMSVPN